MRQSRSRATRERQGGARIRGNLHPLHSRATKGRGRGSTTGDDRKEGYLSKRRNFDSKLRTKNARTRNERGAQRRITGKNCATPTSRCQVWRRGYAASRQTPKPTSKNRRNAPKNERKSPAFPVPHYEQTGHDGRRARRRMRAEFRADDDLIATGEGCTRNNLGANGPWE